MTFGAMATWQGWLLVSAAAAIAGALFLLKVKPQRVLVPSLVLWRLVLDEARVPTFWERIRRAVSLAVAVAIAVALSLAVARPSRTTGAAAGRALIVIDSSWSMRARTHSGPTRWDRAIEEARRIAAASDADVALATTADGLVEGFTSDRDILEAALGRIRPSGSGGSWPRLAGAGAVHFITDGAVPRQLDRGVVVHSVFESAPNVAVTAFAVRREGEAYLEVTNFAATAQNVRVALTSDGKAIFERQIQMGAGDVFRHVAQLAGSAGASLRAHVDAEDDALGIDDEGYAWLDRAQPLKVSIVGRRTDWLRELILRAGGVRAAFVDPDAYRPGSEDVAIFDRWAPREPPGRPALYFAPPAQMPELSSGGSGAAVSQGAVREESRPRWETAGSHPVLRGVDPLTMRIDRARAYTTSRLIPIAQSARGTPLVYVGDSPTERVVVVTFGPGESNLASAPGFPVLVGNALEWLARPESGTNIVPGPMAFDENVTRVTGPDGKPVAIERFTHSVIGILRDPGLYVAEGGGARSTIAVNAGDPRLSNLSRTSLGAADRQVARAGVSAAAWWVYCVAAAFVLILAEWWTWQRRITV